VVLKVVPWAVKCSVTISFLLLLDYAIDRSISDVLCFELCRCSLPFLYHADVLKFPSLEYQLPFWEKKMTYGVGSGECEG